MLKHFLYLNTGTLGDYLSALEGGQRGSVATRNLKSGSGAAGIDLKYVSAQGDRGSETEESVVIVDTPQAQFERLVNLAKADPESSGWLEVLDPNRDLVDIGIGAMIELECDAWVPDVIRTISSLGGLDEAIEAIDALEPIARLLGEDMSNIPSREERQAMRGISRAFGGKVVVVGDVADSEWRIAGQLSDAYLQSDVDGVVKAVGKVSSVWRKEEWRPILALPGSSLLPRAERRALEKTRPDPGSEDQFLEGPAVMLEILAIYR